MKRKFRDICHKSANKKTLTCVDRKKKNYKFIKRSKKAEQIQKQMKYVEDKYRNAKNESSEDETEKKVQFDQLISNFKESKDEWCEVVESFSREEELQTQHKSFMDYSNTKNQHGINPINLLKDKYLTKFDIDRENQNRETESVDMEFEELEICRSKQTFDPFSAHVDRELHSSQIEKMISNSVKTKKSYIKWPVLGNLLIEIPSIQWETKENSKIKYMLDAENEFAYEGKIPELIECTNVDLCSSYVKTQLVSKIFLTNKELVRNIEHPKVLTSLQREIFSVLNNYQDLFYSQRTLYNADEIRLAYCLHVLNHMIKTRIKILHHNAKLKSENKKEQALLSNPYKDQGFFRPKILIILPFRNSAFKVINILASLLYGPDECSKKKYVLNYNRFIEDYTGSTIQFPKKNPKPEDYERTFTGNTDDNFKIGIALTKKSIKLYTDFYSSDILIASPLSLRMMVGASGDADRDFDFLSSIEMLIMDQAELFFAQNWEHTLHILDHMHLQPQSIRNTDVSRVREWCLNGHSKFYRQTVLLTSHDLPEFRSLFNKKCLNYRGKVRQVNTFLNGTVQNIVVEVPQVFHHVAVSSIQLSFDARFKYFVEAILPQYKSSSMSHCMIYIPSYFDYVRLRNYFKSEGIQFVQICEYTKDAKVARARDMFYHSGAHFLLYSERAHLYRRMRIKGIRHLIMYQPPYWPHFYCEMINLMQEANQNPRDGLDNSISVTVLYTKYDLLQMSAIIGTDRANKLCKSRKIMRMVVSNDE